MRKFSCLKLIFCFFLCFLLTFNASFRRDTYAFVPAAIGAEVLVSLLLTAMGIYTTEFLSTDEGQELCRDIAEYLSREYAEWDNLVVHALAGPGFASVPVDYFTASCEYILQYFQAKQPQLFPSYVPPSAVNGTYTSETVKDTMCSLMAEACANNFKDGFASKDYYDFIYNSSFLDRYFRSYIEDCISFDVYLNYSYYINSKNDQGLKRLNLVFLFTSSTGKCFLRRFDCNCSIPVGSSCLYGSPGAGMQEYDSLALALASTVLIYESTENSSLSSVPVSQLIHTATYTNTTVAGDVDVPAVDVPQDIVNLDTDDNAITNPDYITNVVNNYTTVVEGENVIPLHYPAYADTENVIVDGLQDLTRTDVLDGSAKVGVQPVNEVVSTVQGAVTVTGIADAAVDGIVQAITSVFTLSPGFFDGWLNKFQLAFDSKGYAFDFSFLKNGGDNRIPDFYINFRGYDILLIKSDWIYACSDFVRPFIRAYIYFLIIMHDRKRILYMIRGTYMSEEVMYNVDILDAQLNENSDKWLY